LWNLRLLRVWLVINYVSNCSWTCSVQGWFLSFVLLWPEDDMRSLSSQICCADLSESSVCDSWMLHISRSGKDTPLLHQRSGFILKLSVVLSSWLVFRTHGGNVGQEETQQLVVVGTQGKLTVSRPLLGQWGTQSWPQMKSLWCAILKCSLVALFGRAAEGKYTCSECLPIFWKMV
jgi:hypothetical protein